MPGLFLPLQGRRFHEEQTNHCSIESVTGVIFYSPGQLITQAGAVHTFGCTALFICVATWRLNHENSRAGMRRHLVRNDRFIRTKHDQLRTSRTRLRRQLWQSTVWHVSPASEACLQIICLFAILASSPSTSSSVLASSKLVLSGSEQTAKPRLSL